MFVKKTYGEHFIMKTPNELVPKDHLLRELKEKIDFSFIDEITKPYYSNIGRPGIPPQILFKMLFVKYLYGIKSLRRLVEEVELNIAYRWFCEIPYDMEVPHFDTISKNYMRRYKETDVYEKIFNHIKKILVEKKLLNTTTVYMDSTHIKANANKRKSQIIETLEEKKAFEDELINDINKLRKKTGQKKITEKQKKLKDKKVSTTDPEAGFFHKGEHEQIFGYNEHIVCEKNGYILAHKTKPSNVHDSQVFKEVIEPVLEEHENIENIAVDAGYKNGSICKYIIEHKKTPLMPYKNTNRNTEKKKENNHFNKKVFKYHSKKDVYICPNSRLLTYRGTDSNGYNVYKCTKKECDVCPFKSKCCPKTPTKQITHSIYQDYINYTDKIRKTQEGYEEYKTRSQTVERDFGDLKEKHGMRFTYLKGLKTVYDENSLRFACFNMKKMVMFISKCEKNQEEYSQNNTYLSYLYIKISNLIYFIITSIRNKKVPFLYDTFSTV